MTSTLTSLPCSRAYRGATTCRSLSHWNNTNTYGTTKSLTLFWPVLWALGAALAASGTEAMPEIRPAPTTLCKASGPCSKTWPPYKMRSLSVEIIAVCASRPAPWFTQTRPTTTPRAMVEKSLTPLSFG